MILMRLARRIVSALIVIFALVGFVLLMLAQALIGLQKLLTDRIKAGSGKVWR